MSFRWPPERLRVASDSSAAERPSSSRAARARPVGARPAGRFVSLERVLLACEHARHPVEVRDHLRASELRAELVQLLLELHEVGPGVEHRLQRRAVVTGRVLVEVGDASPAPAGDLAAVGGLEAREDLQQRRLAAAVRANDADPGFRLDRQVGAVEDEARAERLRDRAAGEQGHRGRSFGGYRPMAGIYRRTGA